MYRNRLGLKTKIISSRGKYRSKTIRLVIGLLKQKSSLFVIRFLGPVHVGRSFPG